MLYVVAFWHHTGTYHVFASVLIFSRWRVTLAQEHVSSSAKTLLVLAHTRCFRKSSYPKGGLGWVCVSSLQRHCMALLGDMGRGGPQAMAETVSEFRLAASSAWAG